ncbi:MAG: DUF2130 domain-containing protein [Erysipelotrichaceae bacterium]|nr:DUF2130 domain-containing protein [Erysipelotrichaceae bacterium]
MQEIKCPNCGKVFQVDEAGYAAIVRQVRDEEFQKELKNRESYLKKEKDDAVEIAVSKAERNFNADLNRKDLVIAEKEKQISELKGQLVNVRNENQLAIRTSAEDLNRTISEKEREIGELKNQLKIAESEYQLKQQNLKSEYDARLKFKDEEIERYKDFKLRLSTKMVGESLERHCENEFNRIRSTAFPNAYFEKDNDSRTGSKGDYIYRESEDGVEFISIMFEMKNENDTTATKHRNEDFFRELDKDRNEKKCEYAVLVSMLEADSELYNNGIVDVSYRYDKMYVIRPQFFIPLITILRNSAHNALSARRELVKIQNQNIDVANFEAEMNDFKSRFGKNIELALGQYETAINEIDKTIDHLTKVRENLMKSGNNFRLANNKAQELTIKKLTRNSPSIREQFEKK